MHATGTAPAQHDAQLDWTLDALASLRRELARSADTHLLRLDLAAFPGIRFYFKDESTHPSGSLKHRLARSLFLYALCNGRLQRGQTVVDASSGSTAISEAWFARMLGLPFVAVMPENTAPDKIDAVRALDGYCELTPVGACTQTRAREIAAEGACHLDQFGLAERATDWRGNNNIAESIIRQMRLEPDPEPAWIVCGAGTGGTSATIGRYLRYAGLRTRLENRFAELAPALDAGRLEQEFVLWLQKLDVDEELDRLATHVAEARRVLGLKEAVGRRLDFLMQEFNREANTLGSKSVDSRTSQIAVELKVLIEQMREQVQNLE